MTETNGNLNGHAAPDPRAGMDGRKIVDHAKGIVVVMLRGMFSLLAALQYEGVLICIAQAMGEALMEACWSSDIFHTIKLRTKVKQAFEHGVAQVPSMPPAAPGDVQAAAKAPLDA